MSDWRRSDVLEARGLLWLIWAWQIHTPWIGTILLVYGIVLMLRAGVASYKEDWTS